MGSYQSTEQPADTEDEVEREVTSNFQRMSVEPQSFQPKRLRNPLVTILTEILREKAKLDEALVKENNAILKEFLESFIAEMKKSDKMFELLFQHIYYTGSYYSDLRVSKPDEFDLNLLLKLPFKPESVSVQYHPQVPSYVKYETSDPKSSSRESGLAKFFENGYLIPDKVRIWLQSVVDKARTTYRCPRNITAVKVSGSGPARTVILVKKNGDAIDIDLVPAIECSMGLKPPGIDGRVYLKVKDIIQCFLVPKPYQPSRQAPVNDTERARLWRAHYPKAEDQMLHNLGCVKPVIKLLKLLRDQQDWTFLASYYLKTIVLWMVLENSSTEYWRNDKLGERFMDALLILRDDINQRKIKYFFSSRYNLLEKLAEAHASNVYHRLCNIIKDIERDDKKLWSIFGCQPTF